MHYYDVSWRTDSLIKWFGCLQDDTSLRVRSIAHFDAGGLRDGSTSRIWSIAATSSTFQCSMGVTKEWIILAIVVPDHDWLFRSMLGLSSLELFKIGILFWHKFGGLRCFVQHSKLLLIGHCFGLIDEVSLTVVVRLTGWVSWAYGVSLDFIDSCFTDNLGSLLSLLIFQSVRLAQIVDH